MNKRCTKCKLTKDASLFSLDKSRSDGLYPYCRQCVNALQATTKYRNQKARRTNWSEAVMRSLHLNGSDY